MRDSPLRGNDTLSLARPGNDRLLHSAKMLRFAKLDRSFPGGAGRLAVRRRGGGLRLFCLFPGDGEELLVGGHGQPIAPFVLRMAGMAWDVAYPDLMLLEQLIQALPKFQIFHLFPAAGFPPTPALGFPPGQPLGQSLGHILAVSNQFDAGGAFESFQAPDDGQKFHPVIGGLGFGPALFHLPSGSAMPEDKRPPARTRISITGAVRKKHHFRGTVGRQIHRRVLFPGFEEKIPESRRFGPVPRTPPAERPTRH